MVWNNVKIVKAHILLLKKNLALAQDEYCNFLKAKSKFLWEALASQLNMSTQPISVFYNLLFYIRTINLTKKALNCSDSMKTSNSKKKSKKTKNTDTMTTLCCKFKFKCGKNKDECCENVSIDGPYCKLHLLLNK